MKKIFTITALIFMMAFIFYMSAQPAGISSGMSGQVCRILCEVAVPGFEELPAARQQTIIDGMGFWVRKSAHFIEYAVLGMLMYLTAGYYEKSRKRVFWMSLAAGVFYAVTDEVHQYFVPGRSCELRDVMIDGSGVLMGIIILLFLGIIKRKTAKRRPEDPCTGRGNGI